ncbi:hypothetical protein JMJ94_20355 [Rhodovulum visakhapatnamense]|uniref:Carboxypeptidase family protein n=2 Tax=Rhodovulum visakhapatnamense TaxID=364297 RepID=A0ABS1RL98_9RHOB|nr:carboxypeptidase regulatory-like domain-containing protein [Rhodovulum visakhapatnamense]MBL3571810.1 hypothetical protein [Rhodovulum visakhapatnamense]MBL3580431.1 hypothetical protein [Rhodovulum visakhapatnamense]
MQTVVETKNPFDPNAGKYILASGSAQIDGQAFFRQKGGGVVTCAGEQVALAPATPYQQERIQIIYGSVEGGARTTAFGNVPPEIDSRAEAMSRKSVCDADGNFTFRGLAAGDYYVVTRAVWSIGGAPQGGLLSKRIRIRPGEKVRAIIN